MRADDQESNEGDRHTQQEDTPSLHTWKDRGAAERSSRQDERGTRPRKNTHLTPSPSDHTEEKPYLLLTFLLSDASSIIIKGSSPATQNSTSPSPFDTRNSQRGIQTCHPASCRPCGDWPFDPCAVQKFCRHRTESSVVLTVDTACARQIRGQRCASLDRCWFVLACLLVVTISVDFARFGNGEPLLA